MTGYSVNNGIDSSGSGHVTVTGSVFGSGNVAGAASGDAVEASVEALRALIATHPAGLDDPAGLQRELDRLVPAVTAPEPDPEYVRTLLGRLRNGLARVAAAAEPLAAVTAAVAAVVPLVGSLAADDRVAVGTP